MDNGSAALVERKEVGEEGVVRRPATGFGFDNLWLAHPLVDLVDIQNPSRDPGQHGVSVAGSDRLTRDVLWHASHVRDDPWPYAAAGAATHGGDPIDAST